MKRHKSLLKFKVTTIYYSSRTKEEWINYIKAKKQRFFPFHIHEGKIEIIDTRK
ncbi:hypothetical protein ACG2LH_07080 [Zhouia sp. PK063]|uniref:hypothetical protein n=1 Tax=Zhouia sp. PK063 TaxID=3373602 RepID=UPI0037A84427